MLAFGATLGCHAQQPLSPPGTPSDALYATAQEELKKSHFDLARMQFANFAAKYPTDSRAAEALLQQAICEMKLNHKEEAVKNLNWLVQRHSTSPVAADAMEQLALFYESKSDPTTANALREKIIARFPEHPITVRLWVARGDAFSKHGQYAEAVKAYEKVETKLAADAKQKLQAARALTMVSANPDALLDAASERLSANDSASAMNLYLAYLQKYPNAARMGEAKTKLGWCYYVSGSKEDLDRAAHLWQEVVNSRPATDEWAGESQWHMVQLLAGPRQKWEDAVRLCEKIAGAFPVGSFRHEQALYTRAWLLWTQKQWKTSLAAFQDLTKSYPQKAIHPPIVAYMQECERNLTGGKDK
jgi:TolA-binding protein